MNVGVLITDGGPHPPAKWAQVTAQKIIDIGSQSEDPSYKEAVAFQARIVDILTRHHERAQNHERDALATEGTPRLGAEIDTSGHLPDALDEILAAARGTSFAAHFSKPDVQTYLMRVLHEHTHHIMHIERGWHADANPNHPHAKAFRLAQSEGHSALMLPDKQLAAHGGAERVLAMVRNAVPGAPKGE